MARRYRIAACDTCSRRKRVYAKGKCKGCYARSRREAKPELRDKLLAASAKRRLEKPEVVRRTIRAWTIKRKFGITLEEYDAILKLQGGGCAVCGRPQSEKKSLCVDHDHKTGNVRGLLCFHCNYGLSWFKDKPSRLYGAGDYLEFPPARSVIGDRPVPSKRPKSLSRKTPLLTSRANRKAREAQVAGASRTPCSDTCSSPARIPAGSQAPSPATS